MQRLTLVLVCLAVCGSLRAQEPYRINTGDGLSIEVARHPEHSLQVTVRQDGRITHPATGEIEVAGDTLQELTDTLTAALSKTLRAPNVVINLVVRKPRLIYVLGEVPRAGPQEVDAEGVTVKEAIGIFRSGSRMYCRYCKVLAPSISAASAISLGMAEM